MWSFFNFYYHDSYKNLKKKKKKVHRQELLVNAKTTEIELIILNLFLIELNRKWYIQKAYDQAFWEREIRIKANILLRPWITKGTKKLYKTKKKLYKEFMKVITKSADIYLKKFLKIRKSFSVKASWTKIRTALRISEKS